MSKYEILTTEMLIRNIQRSALEIQKLKGTKNASVKIADIEKGLKDLRVEVIPRLLRLDRCSCLFFPVGSYVSFKQAQLPQHDEDWSRRIVFPTYNGIVTNHTPQGKVHVQFEGIEYLAECNPADLKLRFIR